MKNFRKEKVTVERGVLYDILTTLQHAREELQDGRYRASGSYLSAAYDSLKEETYREVSDYLEECNCTSCMSARGYAAPELTGPASEGQETVMRRAFGLES